MALVLASAALNGVSLLRRFTGSTVWPPTTDAEPADSCSEADPPDAETPVWGGAIERPWDVVRELFSWCRTLLDVLPLLSGTLGSVHKG